MTLIVLYLATQ